MADIDYANIELLVLDVDGVMTDGRIRITDAGEEMKAFHVRDGSGMKFWKRAGGKIAMLSGRHSPAMQRRAEELGVDAVRTGAKDKLPAYREILAELSAGPERTAVVGDDLPDLPLFGHCGLAVAVADAVEELRRAADYVTAARGGAGAVREVVELILKRAGKWDRILARYVRPADGPEA
ncbi:MAG TPA: HAD hydrolase family protein [Phycisphaerae bacterium]|nr:HAD hydrolase family protein [Phycisphaerae bacterium]